MTSLDPIPATPPSHERPAYGALAASTNSDSFKTPSCSARYVWIISKRSSSTECSHCFSFFVGVLVGEQFFGLRIKGFWLFQGFRLGLDVQ